MKRHRSVNLLLMLVLLVAVGQMAQTIYIPAIADMARELNVREGAVQSVMAAYLLTYGLSQLVYGPLSDRVGRRPEAHAQRLAGGDAGHAGRDYHA